MPQILAVGVKDAAVAVGLSHWTIRKYLNQGILPFVRIGRRILIEPSELERLVRAGRGRKTNERD